MVYHVAKVKRLHKYLAGSQQSAVQPKPQSQPPNL